MDIGKQIKKIRKEQGKSQSDLGKSLGVSQAMIAQYENGIRKPKYETLERIANALNVSVFDLLPMPDQHEVEQFEYFEIYLKAIGYTVDTRVTESHVEEMKIDNEADQTVLVLVEDNSEIILSKDNQSIILSEDEFLDLSTKTEGYIEKLFKKAADQKKGEK